MRTLATLAASLILSTLASTSCKPEEDGGTPPATTCSFEGQTHAQGTTFGADDDCSVCSCGANGAVSCDASGCPGACANGSQPVCTSYGTIACDAWACFGGCSSDAECAPGGWCRPTQGGAMECAPFVGAGASCQGFVLPWTRQRCEPGLTCVPREATGDLPGTCATCSYGGDAYQVGDSFPADDGCNTCGCMADGTVACTKIGCAPQGCHYFGEDYAAGESFPHHDGCNTCTCTEEGLVACTKIACTLCPGGADPVECFAEPCAVSSCDVAGATCSNDYCGGCGANWFDASGNTICE
ncbi:MAG: hypothetical protein CVU56_04995 [Deltaproteobacteria bacterium HGW-Deltaproteobacteria-14]|jgi:hypothetical protein|nr:MAG: hypothetical protein CVU56_04995 [Deltaproteobacteria bacterium HGW-Deltaproteobacteria-14]